MVARNTTWQNFPSTSTPTSAARMNNIEAPITDIVTAWDRGAGHPGVQTTGRIDGNTEPAGVSQRLWLMAVVPFIDVAIGSLVIRTTNTAGATITLARMALFTVAEDDSKTKVAQTDNDTTIGAAGYSRYVRVLSTAGGFPATYTMLAGVRYAFGWLQVATTAAALLGSYIYDETLTPFACSYVASQTDIAASYTAASQAAEYRMVYMRGQA